jgi:transposase-like protein
MRYSASEKLEIIRLVEQSHLPVRRTLGQIGIPRSTFYRWYDQYQTGGPEALDDRSPRPDRVWNRIPDDVRSRVVTLALDEPELSPRELAVRFTDAERYFVSEASVYRLLKAHDLITSPAFITMKAAVLAAVAQHDCETIAQRTNVRSPPLSGGASSSAARSSRCDGRGDR